MKNLELKVILEDYEACVDKLNRMTAEFKSKLNQTDTYFRVTSGRLKLRQMADRVELIGYHRSNDNFSRLSHYEVMPVSNPSTLKQILKETLGIKGVVVKKRYLWLFENTRIHLDFVKHLGQFIELETVIRKQSLETATTEHDQVKKQLEIDTIKPIGQSYSDLLFDIL